MHCKEAVRRIPAHSRSQFCQAQPTAARVSSAADSAPSLTPAKPSALQPVSGSPASFAKYSPSMLKEFLHQASRRAAAAGTRAAWRVCEVEVALVALVLATPARPRHRLRGAAASRAPGRRITHG